MVSAINEALISFEDDLVHCACRLLVCRVCRSQHPLIDKSDVSMEIVNAVCAAFVPCLLMASRDMSPEYVNASQAGLPSLQSESPALQAEICFVMYIKCNLGEHTLCSSPTNHQTLNADLASFPHIAFSVRLQIRVICPCVGSQPTFHPQPLLFQHLQLWA